MTKLPTFCRLALAGTAVLAVDAAAEATERMAIEEVVVTAQKRSESLTDVPISIAAFTGEDIAKTGVRQMREVAEFVPNVTISEGNDNNTAIRIRGVGATTRNIGFDTRVGVYVDGVYMGQSPAQNLDVFDLERVEIARGPQGTLYGKNTVAGAINLITNKPDDEYYVDVRGEYGNLDSHRVTAVANLPITDRLAARLSMSDHRRDGYVDNITTGTKFNERDGTAVRGQIAWQGDRVDVNLAGDYLESKRTSFFGEAITDWSGNVYPDPAAPDDLEIANDFDNDEKREVWGVSATVNVDLGADYSLTSITAWRDTWARRLQDTDHSPLDLLVVDYPDSYEQFTQELQLFSPEGGRLEWVAGLYYYDEDAVTERQPVVGEDIGVLLGALGSSLAPFGPLFAGSTAGTFGEVDTRSWAVYLNGTYALTERLTLGFGARYTDEKKEVDYALIGDVVDLGFTQVPTAALFSVAIGPVVNGQTVARYQDENDYDDFSPTVSLTYAINDDLNVYVKYSEAFKSGGFNVDFVSQQLFDNGIGFDPETVESYEIGLKGALFDERVRFSLIGFQMDFEDYQLNQFIELGNNLSAITIQNAAEVRSRGVEAEVSWLATPNLLLQAAVGTNDAEFRSFPGGGSARHPDGVGADLKGNKLPAAPELSLALAAQHNYPLGRWNAELVTRIDWTYTDDYYTSEDNVRVARVGSTIPFGWVDDYSILNGRIGIESSDGWSVYLWGRNLLDEDYVVSNESDFFGTLTEFPGDPRTYGVELAYRFF